MARTPRGGATAPAAASAPAFLSTVQPQAPSGDRLEQIRDKVRALRDKAMEVKDLEERLEAAKSEKVALETVALPDMLAAVNMNSFGLDAEGNNPAYDLTVEPLVRANIAAGWDEQRRQAGFKTLEELKGESLIKTVVVFEFGGDERAHAKQFVEDVFDKLGYEGKEALSVNHNSMASWLKQEVQADPPRVPSPAQLQAIGGFVGRIAKIKVRR